MVSLFSSSTTLFWFPYLLSVWLHTFLIYIIVSFILMMQYIVWYLFYLHSSLKLAKSHTSLLAITGVSLIPSVFRLYNTLYIEAKWFGDFLNELLCWSLYSPFLGAWWWPGTVARFWLDSWYIFQVCSIQQVTRYLRHGSVLPNLNRWCFLLSPNGLCPLFGLLVKWLHYTRIV